MAWLGGARVLQLCRVAPRAALAGAPGTRALPPGAGPAEGDGGVAALARGPALRHARLSSDLTNQFMETCFLIGITTSERGVAWPGLVSLLEMYIHVRSR